VVLEGTGFGAGPDVDFAKIMVGNSRVLETDLAMYEQRPEHPRWPIGARAGELRAARDAQHVGPRRGVVDAHARGVPGPGHVGAAGPIVMQVQKRIGTLESLTLPGQPHSVVDAQTLRITDRDFDFACDVVSELGPVRTSNAIPTTHQQPHVRRPRGARRRDLLVVRLQHRLGARVP
jgi:hypothetical protein